jgi:flagellar motor switch protein FliN
MQPNSEHPLFEETPESARAAKPGESAPPGSQTSNMDIVLRIPVNIKVLLGSASMPIFQLTKLGRGAVIPLDRRVGEAVDVMVNNRIIARGEIVVLEEDGSRFGVTLTEMIDNGKLPV